MSSANGYRAGSAFVPVHPSFKGFQLATTREVQKLRPIKIPVEYDVKNAILPKTKPMVVGVKLDVRGGSFEQDLRRQVKAAAAAMGEIEIGAATNEAEQKIRDLKAQLAALSEKRIGVDISADQALSKIAELQAELTVLGERSPNIQVTADTARASAQLAEVLAMADAVGAAHPTVDVDADTSNAERKISDFANGSHPLITLGIALSPILAPLGAVAGAGLIGGAGILGGLAGGAGAGILGAAVFKQAIDGQKKLTQATKTRAAAVQSVKSAEQSLASAQASAADAQIGAARGVADAERSLADARRSGARSITAAEESLADARTAQIRTNREAAQRVAAAQKSLVEANRQVRLSEKAVHDARAQAIRDLRDLRAEVRQNALDVRAAQFAAADAEAKLADIETNVFASSDDIARARLDAAQAEQKVSDARRKSAQDAQDLAKAEATNGGSLGGVQTAQRQLAEAKAAQAQARKELAETRRAATEQRAAAALAVTRAERNLAETRTDAARQVANAERSLARARADGARSVAQAQGQVANAQERVSAAQDKLNTADAARAKAMAAITPGQKRLLAGLVALRAAWHGFLGDIGAPLAGAGLAGMTAIEKALPGLAMFLKPVYRALRDVFTLLGSDLGSKGAKNTARIFGVFSGQIIRDAYQGTRNLVGGFVDLFKAFMPFTGSMSKGIVGLTKKFHDWAAGLGNSKGFQSFIGYVRKEGPQVVSFFGQLLKFMVRIGIALAPLGALLLGGLVKGLRFLNKLPPGALLAIGGGIIAIAIAIMGIEAAPLWLIVLGLVAVAGFLVKTYKKVAWFRTAVNLVWKAVAAVFTFAWKNVIAPMFKAMTWYITKVLAPTYKWLWKSVISPVFSWIGDKVENVGKRLGSTFSTIRHWIGTTLPNAFSKGVAAIGRYWSGLMGIAAKPVNFLIDYVYNKGIRRVLNAIPGHKDLPALALIGAGGGGKKFKGVTGAPHQSAAAQLGFANGGVFPGYTPRRDVHTFTSPTAGTLRVSGGESFMVPEWTRAVGGPLAVARMNKAARSGQLRRGGDVGAFAGGGTLSAAAIAKAQQFAKAQVGKPYLWGQAGPLGFDCSGFMAAITNVLRGAANPYQRLGTTATFPWPGFKPGVGQFTIGSTKNYGGTGVGHMAGTLGGMRVESYGGHGPSTSHRGYDDPGFTTIAHLGAGGSKAASQGGFFGVIGTIKDVLGSIGKWVSELGKMGGWGGLIKDMAKAVVGQIRPWVNAKIPGPGPIPAVFDGGGQLPQGLTLAYHGARKPDKVLTDAQWQAIATLAARGTGSTPAKFDLYDRDGKLMGTMTGAARAAVRGHSELSQAASAAGMGALA